MPDVLAKGRMSDGRGGGGTDARWSDGREERSKEKRRPDSGSG